MNKPCHDDAPTRSANSRTACINTAATSLSATPAASHTRAPTTGVNGTDDTKRG